MANHFQEYSKKILFSQFWFSTRLWSETTHINPHYDNLRKNVFAIVVWGNEGPFSGIFQKYLVFSIFVLHKDVIGINTHQSTLWQPWKECVCYCCLGQWRTIFRNIKKISCFLNFVLHKDVIGNNSCCLRQ